MEYVMLKRFSILIILLFVLLLTGVSFIPVLAQATLGTNWSAQFFNTPDLTGGPVANTIYPSGLNFIWTGKPLDGNGNQLTAVNADNFSARFTSTQNFPQPGTYTFRVLVNEGVRLSVNNQMIINQFVDTNVDNGANGHVIHSANYQIPAAGNYPIVVDFFDRDQEAVLQVAWQLAGTVGPTPTPAPIATGQVVRVRGLSLRTGPYLGASFIRAAIPGTSYAILARNTDEGLFTWYRVTVGDSTGWVSGRYFQTSGNIDAIPFEGSVFDTIDGNQGKGVIGVTRAIMNYRRRPSERATLIGKIPWGAEVDIVGRTVQGGKNHWLQVRYNGQIGWIYAPYIGIRGLIEAIPIF
jgi:uncharacterized protein YraI